MLYEVITEIAYEVFGKKQSQDKEVNIRIYVFNLRKKLKEYYEKEGRNDEIIFSISYNFV